ncbi:PAS domain S-box protein [Chloroflexota bacterium]
MKDEDKTKEQLVDELVEMRQRIAELEALEAEHKQVEMSLRESEAHFRMLADNVSDIIFTMGMNLRFTYVSPSTTVLSGYSIEEVMNLGLGDIMTSASLKSVMKSFAEELAIESAEQEELSWRRALELEMIRKDGSTVWGEVRLTFLRDNEGQVNGIIGIARDITERKQAEEVIRRSEEKYRALIESSGAGIVVYDYDGTHLFINKLAAAMNNKVPDEIIGHNLAELFTEKETKWRLEVIRSVFREGQLISLENPSTINKERHYAATLAPMFDKEGKVISVMSSFRDITERKNAEDKLKEAYAEEVKLRQELEVASQAKSAFLSAMSHELRTPLNSIIGFSELMLDGITGVINDEQRQCLDDILSSGQLLLTLVNQVLDLSKVEAGEIVFMPENMDIGEIIASAVQIMKSILTSKKQQIEVNIAEDIPLVRAEPNKILQILLNLLSNANKYTQAGGQLGIEAVRNGEWCQVSVVDNGYGIKPEDKDTIFEAFSQGDAKTNSVRRGVGLGLTLSKQLIELHGGQIWLESQPNEGSRFTFTLPLA